MNFKNLTVFLKFNFKNIGVQLFILIFFYKMRFYTHRNNLLKTTRCFHISPIVLNIHKGGAYLKREILDDKDQVGKGS